MIRTIPPIYTNEDSAMQGVPFTRYNPETGEITRAGTMQRFVVDMEIMDGQPVLPYASSYGEDYVDLDTMEIRRRHEWEPIIAGNEVMGLPTPCFLTIQGVTYPVEDGAAELSFEFPGVYTVEVESVTHVPKSFEVTYEDPS